MTPSLVQYIWCHCLNLSTSDLSWRSSWHTQFTWQNEWGRTNKFLGIPTDCLDADDQMWGTSYLSKNSNNIVKIWTGHYFEPMMRLCSSLLFKPIIFISTEDFSRPKILINLKRIDRWSHNKATDISDLTKEASNHEQPWKRRHPTLKKRENQITRQEHCEQQVAYTCSGTFKRM